MFVKSLELKTWLLFYVVVLDLHAYTFLLIIYSCSLSHHMLLSMCLLSRMEKVLILE